MVAHLVPQVDPGLEIPLIPVFANEYYPPLPTAERCYALGVAMAEVLADRPERVAIYASGGLSHDPREPRAGWIDEPLDRWDLERLERNDGEARRSCLPLTRTPSAAAPGRSGPGSAWQGRCRGRPRRWNYMPAYHALTGLAFAYWPSLETPEAGSKAGLAGSYSQR